MTASHFTRRQTLQLAAAGLSSLALGTHAQVGDWPKAKAITFVVPFTAGSGTDVIARAVAVKLGPSLGAHTAIDNKTPAARTLRADGRDLDFCLQNFQRWWVSVGCHGVFETSWPELSAAALTAIGFGALAC